MASLGKNKKFPGKQVPDQVGLKTEDSIIKRKVIQQPG